MAASTHIGRERTGPGRLPVPGPPAPDPGRVRRYEDARDVLERARELVARGWQQQDWCTTAPAPSRPGLLGRLLDGPPQPGEVTRACLVGAVAVAAHRGGRPDPVRDAGPALDVVWDALVEPAGRGAGDRAAPREARVLRMRELVRWNDTPGRTRDDVLALLDRAISRTILAAVGGR